MERIKRTPRDTALGVLALITIMLAIAGGAILLFGTPAGATAEEVIQDAIAQKTTAQSLLLLAGLGWYICYRVTQGSRF